MIRRSLIAGSPADWANALRVIDSGKRPLAQRELNLLLDDIIVAQDAEREALALARLTGRFPPRGPKP